MTPYNCTAFPQVVDSTMIADFRSCPERARQTYFEHWKPQGTNIHLHAGACFARGLEVARRSFYTTGWPAEESIAAGVQALIEAWGDFETPEGATKTLPRMCGALDYYFEVWPLGADKAAPHKMPSGKHAIEFSFLEPIGLAHPVSGDPILYSGRFDQIVDFADGLYGEDDKTTSQLGASWGRQWDLRSQFTAYCWGARRNALPLNGMLVRGVSILKTKYDHAEVITYRPQWEIDRWLRQTHRDVARMIQMWSSGEWDFNLAEACNEYGGCEFRDICKSNDPATWLPMHFERRRWDPIERKEHLIVQDNLEEAA